MALKEEKDFWDECVRQLLSKGVMVEEVARWAGQLLDERRKVFPEEQLSVSAMTAEDWDVLEREIEQLKEPFAGAHVRSYNEGFNAGIDKVVLLCQHWEEAGFVPKELILRSLQQELGRLKKVLR